MTASIDLGLLPVLVMSCRPCTDAATAPHLCATSCCLPAQIGAQKLAELTEHTGRSIGEAWTKVGGVGAVKKVGDVWNEAAASDAVKAVGDVLDVAKVKLSTGLPAVGGTDKVRLSCFELPTPHSSPA